jgi:hypothetical protein
MSTPEKKQVRVSQESAMPFTRANYMLLIAGALLLLIGYALLLQPGRYVDAREFSLALYVAPWVILGGFGLLIYAVLRR